MGVGSGSGQLIKFRVGLGQVDPYFSDEFFLNYKNKSMATFLERINKINQKNGLPLLPLVNILQILIILSMAKILYSHEFMMKKSSMLITHCQNTCNYKFTTSKRDTS